MNTAGETVPRLSRAQATDRLVSAATQILASCGPAAVKARSVAEAAGVSTSAVYHHIGGVPELFQVVADRGFGDLAHRFAEVTQTSDPVADLFAHALVARRFAIANPHLYDLMFGLSTRGTYRTSLRLAVERQSDSFRHAYARLVRACERVKAHGRMHPSSDVTSVADQLWSAVHGFVTLELAGHFAHRPDPVRDVLQVLTINILVGEGDSRAAATESHALTTG
ncbi:TetR/AcrR family transcriptional regulator [Rhodococcus sp. (in: high G+C Gram-positive bacteria)]|uniref:TetR/AcrR family transcriptional regulator n=1 Tax=Rhodococcus sp. TaxID=1831 RepID=UPI00257E278C|nr:TetR/AcrR family transcriptional regulator [Rhodococcus sp. (in: high G+C Gram-positive bacteria)]MBQ9056452.1 TetR/AcrR family transcriptional regulator [Rhodococcus sp. (in: high G+C Gram-positive bacteria)]